VEQWGLLGCPSSCQSAAVVVVWVPCRLVPCTLKVCPNQCNALLLSGIPHAVTANGNLTRNGLERIAFLAQVAMFYTSDLQQAYTVSAPQPGALYSSLAGGLFDADWQHLSDPRDRFAMQHLHPLQSISTTRTASPLSALYSLWVLEEILELVGTLQPGQYMCF
jgi:hypothetical protein